jgi:hypothetical protein
LRQSVSLIEAKALRKLNHIPIAIAFLVWLPTALRLPRPEPSRHHEREKSLLSEANYSVDFLTICSDVSELAMLRVRLLQWSCRTAQSVGSVVAMGIVLCGSANPFPLPPSGNRHQHPLRESKRCDQDTAIVPTFPLRIVE